VTGKMDKADFAFPDDTDIRYRPLARGENIQFLKKGGGGFSDTIIDPCHMIRTLRHKSCAGDGFTVPEVVFLRESQLHLAPPLLHPIWPQLPNQRLNHIVHTDYPGLSHNVGPGREDGDYYLEYPSTKD
jgi:hypothetical protein